MRLLHFNHAFFARSETFIKRFVMKSIEFAEVGVAGSKIEDIPEHMQEQLKVFEFPEKFYSRRNLRGAARLIKEKSSGFLYRENKFMEFLQDYQPNLVHCHFGHNGVYLLNLLEKYRIDIPFITTFYGFDASSLPKEDPIYADSLPKLWKRGCAFLAEGPALAERLIDLGAPKEKVKVNPLLIPLQEYPQKIKFRNTGDPLRFLMVGRFVEKKGFHLFLKAIGQIKDQLPAFEVNIIGYGEYEKHYKKIVTEYNIDMQVHFLGGKDHQEVLHALVEHDFFVHPSYTASNGDSEGGAPTILIEAQAIGIPIITSDHADIPFVMGYQDFLSEEKSAESLKDIIINTINYAGWQKLVKVGQQKVMQQHEMNNNTYVEILNSLL